jgi:hypothetical protein
MRVIIQFPNEKVRNVKQLKKSFEEFFILFHYIDVCVDLTNVKKELMSVISDKSKEKMREKK